MTPPIDLALLETGAAACLGGFLGLASSGARAREAPGGCASLAGRTFLLVWVPPALVRLATMLPMADPRTYPELALPLAAPASAALAALLVLAPLAYRMIRNEPIGRRKVLGAAGATAALLIAVAGLVASPFDSSRLADAVAHHSSRCAALARTSGSLRPDEALLLRSLAEREKNESAIEAAGIHARRGLSPALVRLEQRRSEFAARAGALASRAEPRNLAARREAQAPAPRGPAAPAGRAGCAVVEPGMAARDVERLLGQATQRVSAEDVRGPGAERWAYATLLCQIHLVDGVVEFVD